MNIREKAKEMGTKGYRVIADGKHTAYSRYSKGLEVEIASIRGDAVCYRNMLGELSVDFDKNDQQ